MATVFSAQISFFYQNVRGLRSKIAEFFCSVGACDCDVIFLTETWLSESVHSSELFPSEYQVFRRDRDALASGKLDGGGSLIAVRNTLPAAEQVSWRSDVEDLWVTVNCGNSMRLHLCCVYLPCNDVVALDCFLSNIVNIVNAHQDDLVLVCGDFNIPSINWLNTDSVSLLPADQNDIRSSRLADAMSLCNLNQYNSVGNSMGRTLDLVLSNFSIEDLKQCLGFVAPDVYHPPLTFTVQFVSQNFFPKILLLNITSKRQIILN